MLIEWMAYATLLTAFVCCAALAAERVIAIWRGGRRFVWLVSLFAAMLVPALLSVRRIAAPPTAAPSPSQMSPVPVSPAITLPAAPIVFRPSMLARAQRSLVAIDPYLRDAWLAGSLALLILFARAMIGLRRQRSRWREIDLAGARLLLAPDAGPAVVGILHPRVVVPRWALSLDPPARELMLRHETEHIRARDPQLLVVAAFALVLFPWNAGLWFIVRRLRLAVEVDCDHRVLRGSVEPRDYGMLLLTVGARNSASLPLAVSLAERRPFLERRIRAMTTPRPRKPLLASLALTLAAVVATTAASSTPRPAPFSLRAATSAARQAPRSADAAPVRAIAPQDTASEAPADSVGNANVGRALSEVRARVEKFGVAKQAPAARTRGPGVPIELIRAIIKMYHPNVLVGDSSVNLVTIVLDHDLNYVYSNTGKTPTGDASEQTEEVAMRRKFLTEALVATNDSAAKVDVAAVRAAKVNAAYEKGLALGMAYKKEGRAEEVLDSARARYAATEKMAVEASARAAKLDFVNPDAIGSIEVKKFAGGTFAPYDVGVIVIVLKEEHEARWQTHFKFGQIF
jgi:beta-lactamase regulating signal transducer with metallopeptidase domain